MSYTCFIRFVCSPCFLCICCNYISAIHRHINQNNEWPIFDRVRQIEILILKSLNCKLSPWLAEYTRHDLSILHGMASLLSMIMSHWFLRSRCLPCFTQSTSFIVFSTYISRSYSTQIKETRSEIYFAARELVRKILFISIPLSRIIDIRFCLKLSPKW